MTEDFIIKSDLVDRKKPRGIIRFIHFEDGTERSFYSCVNDLTDHRHSGWGSAGPDLEDPVSWVRSVFRDIHKKATKVLSCRGTVCPVCNQKKKKP